MLPALLILIFLALLAGSIVLHRTFRPARVTVMQYERGLLFVNGRFQRILERGTYWATATRGISRVDIRMQLLQVPNQEILTADGISLKITLAGEYLVQNPELFTLRSAGPVLALHAAAQQALRNTVAELSFDALLASRPSINKRMEELLGPEAQALGIELGRIEIRDIMLPAELKRAFAQAATAQKEGLANLERARAETASLRSLANSARLMQEHPGLLQLRAIQAMESSSGNTMSMIFKDGVQPS